MSDYTDKLIDDIIDGGDKWRGSRSLGRAVASAKNKFVCQNLTGAERRQAARQYVNERIAPKGYHLCKYCSTPVFLCDVTCKQHTVFLTEEHKVTVAVNKHYQILRTIDKLLMYDGNSIVKRKLDQWVECTEERQHISLLQRKCHCGNVCAIGFVTCAMHGSKPLNPTAHYCAFCERTICKEAFTCKIHHNMSCYVRYAAQCRPQQGIYPYQRNTLNYLIHFNKADQGESDMSRKDDENFCCIGPTAGKMESENERTWFKDEDDALDHAKMCAKASYQRNGRAAEVFVVEVKKIVTCGLPEVEVTNPKRVTRRH